MGAPCLLVEADETHAESLGLVEISEPRTNCLYSPIPYKYDGLESIFETDKHGTPDIMFLDIDGGEFHLVRELSMLPNIICIECEIRIPPMISYVPKLFGHGHQASVVSTSKMLIAKGYEILDYRFRDMIAIRKDSLMPNSSLCAITVSELIERASQFSLDPINTFFKHKYRDDPHNAANIIKDILDKLICNDCLETAAILLGNCQSVFGLLCGNTRGLTELGDANFADMIAGWKEPWRQSPEELILSYRYLHQCK